MKLRFLLIAIAGSLAALASGAVALGGAKVDAATNPGLVRLDASFGPGAVVRGIAMFARSRPRRTWTRRVRAG
jgi:hypothetical protein